MAWGDAHEPAPTPDYRSELPADVERCSCDEALALRAMIDDLTARIERARKILDEGRIHGSPEARLASDLRAVLGA